MDAITAVETVAMAVSSSSSSSLNTKFSRVLLTGRYERLREQGTDGHGWTYRSPTELLLSTATTDVVGGFLCR